MTCTPGKLFITKGRTYTAFVTIKKPKAPLPVDFSDVQKVVVRIVELNDGDRQVIKTTPTEYHQPRPTPNTVGGVPPSEGKYLIEFTAEQTLKLNIVEGFDEDMHPLMSRAKMHMSIDFTDGTKADVLMGNVFVIDAGVTEDELAEGAH